MLRPPVAQESLELTSDGKVILRLRRRWRDGTRAICFEPTELLEKLAAMIPKPRINLLRIPWGVCAACPAPPGCGAPGAGGARRHGIAPSAGAEAGEAGTVATANSAAANDASTAAPPAGALGAGADVGASAVARPPPAGYTRPKYYAWADLLERTFAVDVLNCPECGGRLRFLATIEDRAVVEKILRHLDLPIGLPTPTPARVTGCLPGFETSADWVTE